MRYETFRDDGFADGYEAYSPTGECPFTSDEEGVYHGGVNISYVPEFKNFALGYIDGWSQAHGDYHHYD